jgi:spore coat polysaccharide biosynthesis predicted glycosyltransferase SpsG
LEVSVIIGTNFSCELNQSIREVTKEDDHHWNLIEAPSSLAKWIHWCDVAISATGLTKYELALLGTPGIFLSIDEMHVGMNESFESVKTGLHLGVYDKVSIEQLKTSLEQLLKDLTKRTQMSLNGMALVDFQGVDRIYNLLSEVN